jgi:hypothetical protein
MRVTLTDDEAREVAGWLRALHADNTRAMAARFDPPERVTAEVREHVYPYMVRERGQTGNEAEYADEAEARAMAAAWTDRWANVEGSDRRYEVVTVNPPRRERLLTCPDCGGTTFGYREGCEDYRTPSGQKVYDDESGTVSVYWSADGTAESGDNDPGLFCDDWQGQGCGVAIDLPDGWEIDYL